MREIVRRLLLLRQVGPELDIVWLVRACVPACARARVRAQLSRSAPPPHPPKMSSTTRPLHAKDWKESKHIRIDRLALANSIAARELAAVAAEIHLLDFMFWVTHAAPYE
jgi:hypothetical protein